MWAPSRARPVALDGLVQVAVVEQGIAFDVGHQGYARTGPLNDLKAHDPHALARYLETVSHLFKRIFSYEATFPDDPVPIAQVRRETGEHIGGKRCTAGPFHSGPVLFAIVSYPISQRLC